MADTFSRITCRDDNFIWFLFKMIPFLSFIWVSSHSRKQTRITFKLFIAKSTISPRNDFGGRLQIFHTNDTSYPDQIWVVLVIGQIKFKNWCNSSLFLSVLLLNAFQVALTISQVLCNSPQHKRSGQSPTIKLNQN